MMVFGLRSDGEWSTLNMDELANQMLEVHRNRQNIGHRMINEEGVKHAQQFTWDLAADKLLKVLF